MKRIKVIFAILAVLIMLLPVISAEAVSTTVNVSATFSGEDVLNNNTVVFRKDITSDVVRLVGEYGGSLNVSNVTYNADQGAYVDWRATINPQNPDYEDLKNSVTLEIVFTVGNKEALSMLQITGFVLSGTPNEAPSLTPTATPTATATDGATPSATDGASPSATDGASPSATDGASPSATDGASPSATELASPTNTVTATPTKRPSLVEPTKDTYTPNHETQAPPTIPPQVTIDPSTLSTPVPELVDPTDAPKKSMANDPVVGLMILFLVLVILLAADITLIIWRKNMGYEERVNNGITRRKVRDDLVDIPEGITDGEAADTNDGGTADGE